MNHSVKSIAPFKSAVCLALVGFFLSYPLIVVMLVFANFAARPATAPFDPILLVTLPLVVAVLLFIFVALGAIFYNLVARFVFAITICLGPDLASNADTKRGAT